jgi:hypothetical protein
MDGCPKGKPYYQRKRGGEAELPLASQARRRHWPRQVVGRRTLRIGQVSRCLAIDGPERAAATLRARPLPHPCPVASISCEPDVVGAAQSAKRAGTQSGDGRCAAGRHHAQGGGSHAERGVPNEFNAAISQVANVGFTFGGAFAGHGVYVTGGNARFILKQYSVSQ